MAIHPIVRDVLVSLAVAAVQEFVVGSSQSSASRQSSQSCDFQRLEDLGLFCDPREPRQPRS